MTNYFLFEKDLIVTTFYTRGSIDLKILDCYSWSKKACSYKKKKNMKKNQNQEK